MDVEVKTKVCRSCGEVKPLIEFHRNKDIRLPDCSECCSIKSRKAKEEKAKREIKPGYFNPDDYFLPRENMYGFRK